MKIFRRKFNALYDIICSIPKFINLIRDDIAERFENDDKYKLLKDYDTVLHKNDPIYFSPV